MGGRGGLRDQVFPPPGGPNLRLWLMRTAIPPGIYLNPSDFHRVFSSSFLDALVPSLSNIKHLLNICSLRRSDVFWVVVLPSGTSADLRYGEGKLCPTTIRTSAHRPNTLQITHPAVQL